MVGASLAEIEALYKSRSFVGLCVLKKTSNLLAGLFSSQVFSRFPSLAADLPLTRHRGAPTCDCAAYNWPHRRSNGLCRYPDEPGEVCLTPSRGVRQTSADGVTGERCVSGMGFREPGSVRTWFCKDPATSRLRHRNRTHRDCYLAALLSASAGARMCAGDGHQIWRG
jgi:hypothetical protein